MNRSSLAPSITLPLSVTAHKQANRFRQQHYNPEKAKQVYLNTLAVSAVNLYLRCMGIETDWESSQSYDPALQVTLDVADLEIKHHGKLECRPVLPHQAVLSIPPDVWLDRVAYVAVQLDASLQSATLLGFTYQSSVEEIPLEQLQSLDDLVVALRPPHPTPQQSYGRVVLTSWLSARFVEAWQSLDAVLGTPQPNLAFSLRNESMAEKQVIQRAKLIDLEVQLGKQSVVLLVAITPNGMDWRSGSLASDSDPSFLEILVQLHPVLRDAFLPPALELSLLSDTGETLQLARSRQHDNYIQLRRFRGVVGESFDIQVSLDNTVLKEQFVI